VKQTAGSALDGLVLGAVLLTIAACASPSAPDSAGTVGVSEPSQTVTSKAPSPSPDASASPSTTPPPLASTEDPAALAKEADELYGAYVRRTGSSYWARSLWGVGCDHYACTPSMLVTTSSSSATDSYRIGSYERLQRGIWPPKPPGAPAVGGCATSVGDVTTCVANDRALTRTDDGGDTWQAVTDPFADRLMPQLVVSLAGGVDAVVGGGDGATLMPFEQVARWRPGDDVTVHRVEHPAGVMGYTSGTVVLSDGRVLTLLADWSDETLKRPNGRHHGLWASDGEDWAAYAPLEPVFSPPLVAPPRGKSQLTSLSASVDPDPVIWVQAWDQRVYVSTDDAATFTELRIR
jgi:hypothetical protein